MLVIVGDMNGIETPEHTKMAYNETEFEEVDHRMIRKLTKNAGPGRGCARRSWGRRELHVARRQNRWWLEGEPNRGARNIPQLLYTQSLAAACCVRKAAVDCENQLLRSQALAMFIEYSWMAAGNIAKIPHREEKWTTTQQIDLKLDSTCGLGDEMEEQR